MSGGPGRIVFCRKTPRRNEDLAPHLLVGSHVVGRDLLGVLPPPGLVQRGRLSSGDRVSVRDVRSREGTTYL